MKISKRNPLLRDNMDEFNNIIGSLGEEIEEQNLENIDGGSTPLCVAISATASSAGCVSAATAVSGAVSAGTKWANDKITAHCGCGGVFTCTKECFGC